MLDPLPVAAYVCDADGLIIYFNPKAEELWGRCPALNDEEDRFCGSFRVFSSEGVALIHVESWMALAIRNRCKYHGHEILVERSDGSRIPVVAYATPMLDEQGRVLAGINMLVDLGERERWDRMLRNASASQNAAMVAEGLRAELAVTRHTLDMLQHTLTAPGGGWESLGIQLMRTGMREMSSLLEMLERPVRTPPAIPV
ncbi:MAG: PAS domain-containing protein [Pseudomonadota bacterium]|nr:PAS domain-containing protein [Pseudomonadota bacterium]